MSRFGRMFEFKPGQARPRPVRNGLIFLGIFGAVLYFMYSSGSVPLWPKGGETIKAEFATSANVTPGKTPVRVRGVEVGEVEKVERREGGRGVVVTMRLNKETEEFDLKRDARADIFWRTLLGFAFYIELDPGSDPEPLGGQTIALANTTTQVEADQVLTSLDEPSRAGVQRLFTEFDKGFNAESEAGRSLDALAPAMRRVAPGLEGFRGRQPGDLTETVRQASRFMGALSRSERDLSGVIANADTTLGVTAAQRAALGSILQNAPATLDETRTTMARLRTTLDELDPVADDLRPGARVLDDASQAVRPALDQLRPALDDARPLLRDLRPAITDLRSAARSGTPFMRGLDPTLDRSLKTILPGLEKVDDETEIKAYEAIGPFFAAVGDSAAQFDRNGTVQRFTPATFSARSAASLPCTASLYEGKIDCADVEKVIGAFLGMPTSRKAGLAALRTTKAPQGSVTPGGSLGSGAPRTGAAVGKAKEEATEVTREKVSETVGDALVRVGRML